MVGSVFAGFIAGYIMAIVFTLLGTVMLVHVRARYAVLSQGIVANFSAGALAVPVSLAAFLFWTAVGMVLGLLYAGAESSFPDAGLGSPNLLFTLAVIMFTVVNTALVFIPLRRMYWPLVALGLSLIVTFGWVLPLLSEAAD